VPVVVRTKDDQDLAKFQSAGASEVVPETIEGSLMLATHALALVGVPMKRVIRMVQVQRNQRYELMRDFDDGDEGEEKLSEHRQ
jgi:CPA2 family monovalent cation:H+ antiporter-2